MTSRYIVSITSQGNVQLPRPLRVQFGGDELDCANWQEAIQAGVAAHKGLIFDVTIDSESIDAATQRAFGLAEMTLACLSAQALGATQESQIELAYDVTPGKREREFRQYYEVPLAAQPVKIVNSVKAGSLLKGLDSLNTESEKARSLRAMQALRRGFSMHDGLGRFQEFWIGLECLNPLLESRLQVEKATWFCECGKEYVKEEARGVKAFVHELLGEKQHRAIAKVRRDIFHGVAPFGEVQQAAGELSIQLEGVLYRAIRFALGASLDEVKASEQITLHRFQSPRIRLTATLSDAEDATKLSSVGDTHPRFVLGTKFEGARQDGATTTQIISHTVDARVACDWRVDELTVSLPKGTATLKGQATYARSDGTTETVELTPFAEDVS